MTFMLGVIAGGANAGGGAGTVLALLPFDGAESSTAIVNAAPGSALAFTAIHNSRLQASEAKAGPTGLAYVGAPGEAGGFESTTDVTLVGPFCMECFYRWSFAYQYGGIMSIGVYESASFLDVEFSGAALEMWRQEAAADDGFLGMSSDFDMGELTSPFNNLPHIAIIRDNLGYLRVAFNGEVVIGPVYMPDTLVGKVTGLGGNAYGSPGSGMDAFRLTSGSPVYTDFPFVPPKGDYTPARSVVAIGYGDMASQSGHPLSMDVLRWSSRGFGSKYSQPSTAPASHNGKSIDTNGSAVVYSATASDMSGVAAYVFSKANGFGTRFTNLPSGSITGAPNRVRFSRDGRVVFTSRPQVSSTSEYQRAAAAFKFDTSNGFGAAYAAAPSTGRLMADGRVLAPSPDGNLLLCGDDNGPVVYGFGYDTGFTTSHVYDSAAFKNLGGTPAETIDRVNDGIWSPDGGYAAFATRYSRTGTSGSPFGKLVIHPWTGTAFGERSAAVDTGSPATCVGFSEDGSLVAVGMTLAPYVAVYPFNAGVLGAKMANPASLPTVESNPTSIPGGDGPNPLYGVTSVRFTHDHLLVTHGGTNKVTAYQFRKYSGFGPKATAPLDPPIVNAIAMRLE